MSTFMDWLCHRGRTDIGSGEVVHTSSPMSVLDAPPWVPAHLSWCPKWSFDRDVALQTHGARHRASGVAEALQEGGDAADGILEVDW